MTGQRITAPIARIAPPLQESCPAYYSVLYAKSEADRFGIDLSTFADILSEIARKHLPLNAKTVEVEALHHSLHLRELVLARACAAGIESAWEEFVAAYKLKLRAMATNIAKEQSTACELADSLYSDLYVTRQSPKGVRISKLASYTGRGSLEGWLRMVLAQAFIDRYRQGCRLSSFDETTSESSRLASQHLTVEVPADSRIDGATDAALGDLPAEDRLILASYHLDGRTLAEIGRMLGTHESTVSRRLDRIIASIRKRIVRELRQRGMDANAAEEALNTDVRDLTLDVRSRLAQEKGSGSVP